MTLRIPLGIETYSSEHLEAAARVWQESFESSGVPDIFETTMDDLKARIVQDLEDEWDLYLGWQGVALVGFLALKPHSNLFGSIVRDARRSKPTHWAAALKLRKKKDASRHVA